MALQTDELLLMAAAGLYLYTTEPARMEALDLKRARRLLILLPAVGYIRILLCYAPAAYGPASAAWRVLTLVRGAKESAAVFDRMDDEIRAAKERGVMDQMVPAVDDVETRFGAAKTELHIERDPENWKNKCVARFYGINSVKTS